jgi:hypothetical protein
MPSDQKAENPLDPNAFIPGRLIKNPSSMVGLALAVVAFANILFLILVNIISTNPNPYLGILTYMVMPAFLILGFAVGGSRHGARAPPQSSGTGRRLTLSQNRSQQSEPTQFSRFRAQFPRHLRLAERG